MKIKITQKGDFSNIEKFFNKVLNREYLNVVSKYAEKGLDALKNATPKDSHKTAESWNYVIESNDKETSITYINTNVNKGVNIAIILQYGHATRNGGYVQGIDYINPALKPVFEEIAVKLWEEVTST